MDLHIGHPMSSASVCSRREPSKIAQGKRSAALGKRQTEGIRPGGADRTLTPRIAESNDGAGLSHRPSRAGISWSNPSPGFHPGLFSSLPSGKNRAECLVIPPLRTAAGGRVDLNAAASGYINSGSAVGLDFETWDSKTPLRTNSASTFTSSSSDGPSKTPPPAVLQLQHPETTAFKWLFPQEKAALHGVASTSGLENRPQSAYNSH
jgi:hypothetical protein